MSDPDPEITAALEELRARVDAIEAAEPAGRPVPATGDDVEARLWLADALARRGRGDPERDGTQGRIAYGGRLRAPGSGEVVWQLEHPVADVLGGDLDGAADVLQALGHPFRLALLRRLLLGAQTLSELAEVGDGGTTGQLHHHLRELRSAGLVVSRRRNHYEIPTDRVVAVLIIVAAALGRDLGSRPDAG